MLRVRVAIDHSRVTCARSRTVSGRAGPCAWTNIADTGYDCRIDDFVWERCHAHARIPARFVRRSIPSRRGGIDCGRGSAGHAAEDDQDRRAFLSRGQQRRHRPRHRRSAREASRHSRDYRKQGGCCRRDRRRLRREIGARRFCSAAYVIELSDRSGDSDTIAVRPDCRVCTGGDGRPRPDAPCGLGEYAIQVVGRPCRRSAGHARCAQLRAPRASVRSRTSRQNCSTTRRRSA